VWYSREHPNPKDAPAMRRAITTTRSRLRSWKQSYRSTTPTSRVGACQ